MKIPSIFFLLIFGVYGCGYQEKYAYKRDESCKFTVKTSENNEERNRKINYIQFFLEDKILDRSSFSTLRGENGSFVDEVEFTAHKNCRDVLETVLEKI